MGCRRHRTDPISGFAKNGDAPEQVRNDLTSDFTAKYIGGVYPDDEHATDCIDNDRSFSALNEFAPVKSQFYIGFRGFLDTLDYQ